MTISDYQIQNVLRTYQRQLRLESVNKPNAKGSSPLGQDEVNISIEGKKKQIYEQVAAQVKERLLARLNE